MNRKRVWLLSAYLVIVFALSSWAGRGYHSVHGGLRRRLPALALPYRAWSVSTMDLSAEDRSLLVPDDYIIRNYSSPDGLVVQLAVVAGRQKRSIHTPAFCMTGAGWETIVESRSSLLVGARHVPTVETMFLQGRTYLLTTYFFTDGSTDKNSLIAFQWHELLDRLRGRPTYGALVRITVPLPAVIKLPRR
jgi:EpsI family protein